MQRSKAGWILAALVLGAIAPQSAAAQFASSQKYLGAHLGMSGVGSAAAIGVNGEMSYNENIGIGFLVDTWSYGYSAGGFDSSVRYMSFAGTGAYHFPIKTAPKWDPFVGVAVGYFIVNYESDFGDFDVDGNRIYLGGFGGARYFFKPSVTGVARLGFGASYLSLGVDFKL
ncbi:MAG: hypothetical protein ACREMA_06790 [Longimicrobiales bacterium]